MKDLKEALKEFIIEKVKQTIRPDRPFMFVKWSGLHEICKYHGFDLLELIDELCQEKRLKKAIIRNKLAITLPNMITSKKASELMKEFQKFINGK